MSRKKKKKIQETTIENYYDLRVDKVDELVSILKGEDEFEGDVNYEINANMGTRDPKNISYLGKEKKFDPYKTDFLGKIPKWLKAIFIKFWFAGAVCYFMMFGIMYNDSIDALVFTGAVLGIIVDILVNPILRYFETSDKEYNVFMMFPFPLKKFWTLFTNIIYYIIVLMFVGLAYSGINELSNFISGTAGHISLGVEPLLFGVFTVIVDMAFIGIKDGIVALVRHLRKKKKEGVANA